MTTDTPAHAKPLEVFISYPFEHEAFATELAFHLKKQPHVQAFCYAQERRAGQWPTQIDEKIEKAEALVVVVGATLGQTQAQEVARFKSVHPSAPIVAVHVVPEPASSVVLQGYLVLKAHQPGPRVPYDTARQVIASLKLRWIPEDDIPDTYLYDYEKTIIEQFAGSRAVGDPAGDDHAVSEWVANLERGLPHEWPSPERAPGERVDNCVGPELIGPFRDDDAEIVVEARLNSAGSLSGQLTLREAAPREKILLPTGGALRVGVLVSGGIAPGINAVIGGIIRQHGFYWGSDRSYLLEILGYMDGFRGLLPGGKSVPLQSVHVDEMSAGSILGTSRVDELLPWAKDPVRRSQKLSSIVEKLYSDNVSVLYVIGGDGSMRAAHAIWRRAEEAAERNGHRVSVVGIPKTMDNDILWAFRSLGFASAVEKAAEIVNELEIEAAANGRIYVVQLFGSDSGFVACDVALSTRVCRAILIPEIPFSVDRLCEYVCEEWLRPQLRDFQRNPSSANRPHGIIVMSETAIPSDIKQYVDVDRPEFGLSDAEKRAVREYRGRVLGHTPDELRPVGLKIVVAALQERIRAMAARDSYWGEYFVRANEPRHVIRAVPPLVLDVVTGQRMGALAVDNAMAGYTDVMVSQWLTEYALVPLKLVVLGRKRVPPGYFQRAAVASTGQPDLQ